jgi:ribonuclease BN (tRNA processing enzyme)
VELIVLGCSGSGAGPTSPASGYLVRTGATTLVMDLGNGTFGTLQRHLDPFDLDGVVLSHLHPDHCADVSGLVVHRRYHPDGPGKVLPLHGPSESEVRLAVAYAPSSDERVATDLTDVFDYHVFADGPAGVGDIALSSAPVDHPCEAYGVRLEHEGRSLVYSGDTGPCQSLVDLARGADVLLCESTWSDSPERPRGVHLSGRQAGPIASDADVGRLLLTHVPPWADGAELLEEARKVYAGPVELVVPDGRYRI